MVPEAEVLAMGTAAEATPQETEAGPSKVRSASPPGVDAAHNKVSPEVRAFCLLDALLHSCFAMAPFCTCKPSQCAV